MVTGSPPPPAGDAAAPGSEQRARLVAFAVVAALTFAVFSPTLGNGFLLMGFDDRLILDNPEVAESSWSGVGRIFTTFRHANYIPLTTLSFAVTHRLAGFDPLAYHLVNLCLHTVNAILVWLLVRPLLASASAATFATLVFALHPLQLEAVSLAIQRKTLMSAALFLLAFLSYRSFWESGERRHYLGALLCFALSVLAKPITVTFPVVLLLYESQFVRRRPRLADKIPFFAVAVAGALLAMQASHEVGAMKVPHGGTWPKHALMVGRVSMEYLGSLFAPFHLSPIYYYRLGTETEWTNVVCLAALVSLLVAVVWWRKRLRWTYFCLGWFAILLFPQSNVIPLAQLRPDRYLYLSLIGFGIWLAIGLQRAVAPSPQRHLGPLVPRCAAAAFVAVLAVVSFASTPIWRSDATAWARVVERHPWCAIAHQQLGLAYLQAGDAHRAASALEQALRLKPELTTARTYLARSYEAIGR